MHTITTPLANNQTGKPYVTVEFDAPRRVRLELLGRPQIFLNGKRQTLLERCDQDSLLVYLLALHRRGLSGGELSNLLAQRSSFYSDDEISLHSVRQTVYRVRRKTGWQSFIQSSAKSGVCVHFYSLPHDTACDLWEFEDKLNMATHLQARVLLQADDGSPERAANLRADAIALYKGAFCEGLAAGPLVQAAIELERRFLGALIEQAAYWKGRAEELRAAGGGARSMGVQEETAWQLALYHYELAIRADCYYQPAYMGIKECHACLGNSAAVARSLERYQYAQVMAETA